MRTSWLFLVLALAAAVLLFPAASTAPAANPKLFACVGGGSGNADAFSIHLTTIQSADCTASSLTTIPAGTYDIQVDDWSTFHNFDLKDPNGVTIKSTSVGAAEHTTWTSVNLTSGSYLYQCDAHAFSMKGTFTVTKPASAWSAPFDVSTADTVGAFDPGVGVDSTANARFVWQKSGNSAVQTRSRTSGGSLGAVSTWDTGGGLAHPQLAVDPSGAAAWAWLYNNGSHVVVHARAFQGGTLRAKQTLSDAATNSAAPQVAVDAGGNAYFVWGRSGGGVYARTWNANGTLGSIQEVAAPATAATQPQVAAGASGKAVFVWLQKAAGFTVVVTRVLSGGTLTAPQTLSSTSQNALAPQVAVDGAGNGLYTWTLANGTAQERRRTAAGGIGSSAVNLSATTGAGGQAQVAVDRASGKGAFVWRHQISSTSKLVAQGRTISATGALGALKSPLSTDGADAVEPQVGIDGSGNVVFAWQRGSSVQARTLSSTGTLGTTTDVGATGGIAGHPALAVAGNGKALVAWIKKLSATDFRIQAAAGP